MRQRHLNNIHLYYYCYYYYYYYYFHKARQLFAIITSSWVMTEFRGRPHRQLCFRDVLTNRYRRNFSLAGDMSFPFTHIGLSCNHAFTLRSREIPLTRSLTHSPTHWNAWPATGRSALQRRTINRSETDVCLLRDGEIPRRFVEPRVKYVNSVIA